MLCHRVEGYNTKYRSTYVDQFWPLMYGPHWEFFLGLFYYYYYYYLFFICLFFPPVFCSLHPELIAAPRQKCFIDSVKRNDYPKYILVLMEIWVHKISKGVPPPPIQNLLYKCSESEFYHNYVLLWEISFLFTDKTQHKMLHGFSCKH
jgi:hypothetical protein